MHFLIQLLVDPWRSPYCHRSNYPDETFTIGLCNLHYCLFAWGVPFRMTLVESWAQRDKLFNCSDYSTLWHFTESDTSFSETFISAEHDISQPKCSCLINIDVCYNSDFDANFAKSYQWSLLFSMPSSLPYSSFNVLIL